MKILVIDGAVRKDGDTNALLSEFLSHFKSPDVSVKTIGFPDNVKPCTDCRFCEKNCGCTIDDKMAEMWNFISECDVVVVASPVWYCCPSGVCLNILSRFQTFFNAKKRNDKDAIKEKCAAVLLAAGGSGGTDGALKAIRIALSSINVSRENIFTAISEKTDVIPSGKDDNTKAEIKEIAQKIKDLS